MDSGIQSSFIPKDAGKASIAPRLERGGGLGSLVFLIAIVLFVASCALAGAVFLYQQYLSTSAASKVAQLKTAQAAFDPTLIQRITRLDDRMRAADTILSGHLAPTAFFLALQATTLSTVEFTSLTLEASDPKNITIRMNGVAQSVNSIALEADVLARNGVFASPIFSGISRQQDGVHFQLAALMNPAALNYVSLIGASQSAAIQAAQAQAQQQQVVEPGPAQASPFGAPSDAAPSAAPTPTQPQTPTQSGTSKPQTSPSARPPVAPASTND